MKRLLSAICIFMALVTLLCSCKEKDEAVKTDTKESTEADTEELILSDDMLYIVAGKAARYGIVRKAGMSLAATSACSDLYFDIEKKTGITVPFIDDTKKLGEGIKEILVGNTNREESKTALEEMGDSHWSISVHNEKICIVAVNDGMLAKALETFAECYVNVESELSDKGVLAVPKDISKKMTVTENLHALNVFEGAELEVEAVTKFKLNVSKFTQSGATLTWVQGGCSDGKYLYQFMISNDSKSCVIVKFDLETQQEVGRSNVLDLGHANDAAYNPHNNTIVVADCMAPYYNKVHILDADALKIIKTLELDRWSAGQLSYDKETRQYITASNSNMYFWDEEFKLVKTRSVKLGTDYHTQGMVSDGEYVYRLEYWQNPKNEKDIKNNIRIIRISDGKQIALIDLGIAREAENIITYDEMFYVCFNNSSWNGSEVYAFDLVPR